MARVLFQAVAPQLLRATSIGYLYEIAQKHRVVLLTREVDSCTKKTLADKNMFPGLEKIIFFEWPFEGNVFLKNYRAYKIVKEAIRQYAPDIVVTQTDIWPPDTYLLRFAKQKGATTIAIQAGFKIAEQKKLYLWSCLMNSYSNLPGFLPLGVKLFLVKVKKYIGHFFYYWILPLTVGEMPFPGKSSFVFWHESWGLRDADYAGVFSKRDYDICIKDGVKPEKLFVFGHPMEHPAAREFFKKTYFANKKEQKELKTLTIMWPNETIGFRADDRSLISEEQMWSNWVGVASIISTKLADWRIFIKPHPAVKEASKVKKILGEIPQNVFVVNPSEPADTYIEMSSVIVGMPLPSTTLFTASKQNPEKIVLSLNLHNEFLGDSYKDFNGIEYVDSEEKFHTILDFIRNGTYQKKVTAVSRFDFADAAELIDHLYAIRNT